MRLAFSIIILLATLLNAALGARADTIFNSFGTGDTSSGWGVRIQGSDYLHGLAIAASFTPTSDYLFNSADFPFHTDVTSGLDEFDIYLMYDSDGFPSTIIESFQMSIMSGQSPEIYTITSASNPLLTGGTMYWFAVFPHYSYSYGGWHQNLMGIMGYAYLFEGQLWGFDPEETPAFRVEGTPIASQIPEPASFILIGSGLCIISLAAWRRRK